jgi:amino acid permease
MDFPDGLAAANNAPRIFLRTSKNGLPYVSIIFCSMFSLLAVSVFSLETHGIRFDLVLGQYMGISSGSGKGIYS